MAKYQAVTVWQGEMAFAARTGSGHEVTMDAAPEVGGGDQGPRPTELLLASLGACTAMDVISILRKMRVQVDRFEVATEGERAAEHPRIFTGIEVVYRLWSPDPDPDVVEKYRKAVDLSWTKYCSIANLLKFGSWLRYRAELNGAEVFRGEHPAPAHLAGQG